MKKQNKIKLIFFILSIIFSVIAIFACVYIKNNNIELKILLSALKSIPMLLILGMSFFGLKNKNHINKYKKFIIIALLFSLIGDVSIIFNFIIGGGAFLIASVFFILSFFNHHSFKEWFILNKKSNLKHKFFVGVILSFTFFLLFILYASIFVYPFLNHDLIVFKILFPIYVLFLSIAVGASFFGKVPNTIKLAMIIFFFSDIILFYNFSFNFPLITVILNLSFYYLSQNLFAYNIDE